ncbi:alkaline phosphatase family protein [Paenibacillus sp. LHD-38]|uniref:alkaline phosphatase family protein n=1 Tax=Paenibacillus sp. LHD-38 TaxID=3072143 RepID=UPI00280EB779|nr:alkaline phosphatase family protein [Paenibacillus sp. LHD-38]MDQ8736118.1 alkaline phosphatase family protein [Paenibacillus sp. LHD-38]
MKRNLKMLAVSSISAAILVTSAPFSFLPVYANNTSLDGAQASVTASQAAAQSNAVLNLKFDNNAVDSSTSAVSAVVNGNPEFVQGRIGQAIRFKSPGQYVDLGARDEFRFGESADFSVAFWIKSEGIIGDPSIISNKDWNSGSNTGWILAVNGSGGLIWNYKTSQSSRLDTTLPNVADNKWHHIVVSHDRKNGSARFYKDGILIKTVDISGMKGTLDSPYTTKIGQDGTGKYGSTLTAQVDDMQIYRNVMTETEVRDMYDSAPPLPPTLVENVTLDQTELNLKAGAPMPLTVTVSPIDATVKEVKWISSDETVAKVEIINERPTVIAGKPGVATITVKTVDGGKTASVKIHVSNSIDVTGDGLLTKEDLNAILKNQNSSEGDNRWEKAQIADINDDKKVDHADVQIMEDKLAPYKKDFLYKRVVFIGIDGFGNAVKDPQANAVHIQKLMSEGAGTYEAKAMLPTISAENWGAMFHGVEPSKHKLTNAIVAATPYPEKNDYPSFMKLLKQERPMIEQASFATWSPINKGIIEDSAGAFKVNGGNDETTTQKTVDYIKTEGLNARNIFVHLDEVDVAGHTHGYYTPKFYEQAQKADQYVGQIVQALEEAGLMEDTLIVLTSDHGGKGKGHGGSSPEEQTIFWAAKGKSIAPGTILSDEVRNVDTAAVVAHALRLDIPANWDAKIPAGLFQDKK